MISIINRKAMHNLPQVAYKSDLFTLEGDTVILNGDAIAVPMHKTYKDGSELRIEDIGKCNPLLSFVGRKSKYFTDKINEIRVREVGLNTYIKILLK
jgi:hypothetical protein